MRIGCTGRFDGERYGIPRSHAGAWSFGMTVRCVGRWWKRQERKRCSKGQTQRIMDNAPLSTSFRPRWRRGRNPVSPNDEPGTRHFLYGSTVNTTGSLSPTLRRGPSRWRPLCWALTKRLKHGITTRITGSLPRCRRGRDKKKIHRKVDFKKTKYLKNDVRKRRILKFWFSYHHYVYSHCGSCA